MDNDNSLVTPQPAEGQAIRSVDVGRGVEWLAGGFRMFGKAPGVWVLIVIALVVGSWILGMIGPGWMSGALSTVVGTAAMGVLMRCCKSLDDGVDIATGAQATASLAPLWMLGVFAMLMSIALHFLAGLLGLSSMVSLMMSPSTFIHVAGLSMLIYLAASIVMGMAIWLAPALVVLKGVAPLQAIKMSLSASLKNIVPYLIYSLLAIMLCVIAAIPLGLGLLVALPMIFCSSYLAYKDIFAS